MAITFVGSSNVANGLAAGTSAVVPRPVGVVDGDLLLAFISIGVTSAITAPAGWTEVPLGVNTAPNLQNRIYSKVASSEPASWTWTFANAAYVGIAHATRGVGGVVQAQQSDDGLSILVHTTPTLPAPTGSWLVSSFTGRNLLALGWGPPAGDTERQDVIGGLLVLLNVNHAVDDTNGPVTAGNYSKTAGTLLAVRALDALVVLAPAINPVVLGVLKSPVSFGTFSINLGVTVNPVKSPISFGTFNINLNLTMGELKSPVSFGDVRVMSGLLLGSFPGPVVFGALDVSHTLTLTDILSSVQHGSMELQQNLSLTSFAQVTGYGVFGVDAEISLVPIGVPVVSGDFVAELELIFQSDLPIPVDLDPLTVELELTLVDHINSPLVITEDIMLLEEHSIMIFPRLPIPIIPGSGNVWDLMLFRTLDIDEPEPMVASPTSFGRLLAYREYTPACCTIS